MEFRMFKKLHDTWNSDSNKGRRLQILAFPSAEFGGQEHATDEEVLAFAKQQQFPGIVMKLGTVKDCPSCQEIWKFLRLKTGAPEPTWNFGSKFLVSKTGEITLCKEHLQNEVAALVEA